MPIMAAGMHLARVGRGIVNARFLHDWQSIKIRPQANRFTFTLPIEADAGGQPDTSDAAIPPSNDLLADNP